MQNLRDRTCWQWANFTMGPNEQSQHFSELRQTSMFIHTRLRAPKMFVKVGCKTRTFCNKKEEKKVSQAWTTTTTVTRKRVQRTESPLLVQEPGHFLMPRVRQKDEGLFLSQNFVLFLKIRFLQSTDLTKGVII